jgi:hypothetical protein
LRADFNARYVQRFGRVGPDGDGGLTQRPRRPVHRGGVGGDGQADGVAGVVYADQADAARVRHGSHTGQVSLICQ